VNKVHGTPTKFIDYMKKQRPRSIHFSGHVVLANEIKKDLHGDALLLEDENCINGHYLYADELSRLITSKLDFVFMGENYDE